MIFWQNKRLYDGKLSSDAAFTRNAIVSDGQGNIVGLNSPRFTDLRAIAGRPQWTSTGLTISGSPEMVAAGVDHDNTTPIVVVKDATAGSIRVYSGTTLTLSSNTTYSALYTALSSPAGHTYTLGAAYVISGAIFVVMERKESGTIKGHTTIVSQDKGSTWAYLQARNSAGTQITATASRSIADIASPAVTAPSGILRTWSVTGFPKNGLSDRLGFWVCVADYQAQTGCKGGQVSLIGMTRGTETGTWTITDHRVIYEYENTLAGVHCHSCGVVGAGMISFWGDTENKNRIVLHAFDLSTYQTASVTNSDWHGALDNTNSAASKSPQPVSACPSPDGGILASADETYETIVYVGPVTDSTYPPVVKSIQKFVGNSLSGVGFDGIAPLHLRWCYGDKHVWCAGGGSNQVFDISTDGVNFARLHIVGSGVSGPLFSDGNALYMLGSGTIYKASLPNIIKTKGVRVTAGTNNYLNNTSLGALTGVGAIGGTNTMEELYYDGRTYRKVSDNSAIDPQPLAPPPDPTKPIYLWNIIDNRSGGRWRFNTGDAKNFAIGDYTWQFAAISTDNQSCLLRTVAYLLAGSYTESRERIWSVSSNVEWQIFRFVQPVAATRNSYYPVLSVQADNSASGSRQDGTIMIQPLGMSDGKKVGCIVGENLDVAISDEVLTQPVSFSGSSWSIAATIEWGVLNDHSTSTEEPLLTLYKDANNHAYLYQDSTNSTLVMEITVGGSLVDTLTLSSMSRFESLDSAHIVVSSDGTTIRLSATTPHNSGTDTTANTFVPSQVMTGGPAGESPMNFAVIGVSWSDGNLSLTDHTDSFETLEHLTSLEMEGSVNIQDELLAALATAENDIADAILARSVATVESSAAEHSLCTLILAALEFAISGTTWTIKRTDGTTTHITKTLTSNAAAENITSVD